MRVAIVHHWFISLAGGERVVDTIASIFPTADIFTLFLDKQKLPPALRNHKITTSFLDKTPAARRAHRHFFPFYPLAVEMLNLSGYDLVITSDSGPMKGVLTDPGFDAHLLLSFSDALPLGWTFRLSSQHVTAAQSNVSDSPPIMFATGTILQRKEWITL